MITDDSIWQRIAPVPLPASDFNDLFCMVLYQCFRLVNLPIEIDAPIRVLCPELTNETVSKAKVHRQEARPFAGNREAVYQVDGRIPGILIHRSLGGGPDAFAEAEIAHTCQ